MFILNKRLLWHSLREVIPLSVCTTQPKSYMITYLCFVHILIIAPQRIVRSVSPTLLYSTIPNLQ